MVHVYYVNGNLVKAKVTLQAYLYIVHMHIIFIYKISTVLCQKALSAIFVIITFYIRIMSHNTQLCIFCKKNLEVSYLNGIFWRLNIFWKDLGSTVYFL